MIPPTEHNTYWLDNYNDLIKDGIIGATETDIILKYFESFRGPGEQALHLPVYANLKRYLAAKTSFEKAKSELENEVGLFVFALKRNSEHAKVMF